MTSTNLTNAPVTASTLAWDARGTGTGDSPADKVDRIALIHEWFERVGGSEQVFLQMTKALPDADRFVLWNAAGGQAPDGLRESWLARTPLRHHKSVALPLMPLAWRTLTRDRFDVVVSSSHAFAHTVRLGSSPDGGAVRHLSYIHSPARYLWTPDLDERNLPAALTAARPALRTVDRRLGRHVTSYAANSGEVRDRIRWFWRRDARVIHPPVKVDFFTSPSSNDVAQDRSYLLGVGRWIGYKNFDLVIETASRAGLPLVVAGSGPDEARLRSLAATADVPIRFEVNPSDERLRSLYWGAAALLFPVHEDFGIVPVEAQAAGVPVVGLSRGGLLETVTPGVTGFLVDELDPVALASAAHAAVGLDRDPIRAHARRFDEETFRRAFTAWVTEEGGADGPRGTGGKRRG